MVFINDKCEVFHQDDFQYSGTVQFNAINTNGLYKLNAAPNEIKYSVFVTNETNNVLDFCNQCMSATFLDDHSRKIFPYFLKSKDQTVEKFTDFKNLVENQSGKRIKKYQDR